jgi:hypothetical protein
MPVPAADRDVERELHEFVASFAMDPLGFVQHCYYWPIKNESGPDAIQQRFLAELGEQVRARAFDGIHTVMPIRMAISSGHGIGKSALGAWIVHWIMSTRRNCHGTVTANTNDQLDKKTWNAIREWHRHLVNAHWFEINSAIMYHKAYRESWFVSPQSCAEENSEAFAGQHEKASTSFYLFDEASAVPDTIWNVAYGGLTDGEPMFVALGNPTRNTGEFYRNCFGAGRERWTTSVIDSRESSFSNKALIQEWIDDYGEDSDFVRVRVRGLPPNADELQYIDGTRIYQAQTNVPYAVADEPLIAGVDVSGGGSSMTVCMFRRGLDARAIKPITLTGEQTIAHERQLVISTLVNALVEHPVTAMFIDAAFGAPIVVRLRQMGYTNVHEVNFGGPSADPYADNARAAMWKAMKEWLPKGAIDQHDHRLATELASPGYHLSKKNKLVIESKESMQRRGVASPDRADALALTWAMPVNPKGRRKPLWGPVSQSPFG